MTLNLRNCKCGKNATVEVDAVLIRSKEIASLRAAQSEKEKVTRELERRLKDQEEEAQRRMKSLVCLQVDDKKIVLNLTRYLIEMLV
jgi:septal ring factor EnvC (AmiA/AmiB activator)